MATTQHLVFQEQSSRSVSTLNKSLKIQQSSYSLREIRMDSTQGAVCLQNVLIYCVNAAFLVLTTKCLPKNVACNLQLVCSFPCIMLMYFFILLLPFGVRSILSKQKLNQTISELTGTPSQCYPVFSVLLFSLASWYPLLTFLIPKPLPW